MKLECRYLLDVIKYILHDRQTEIPIPPKGLDWKKTLETARRHSVSNLLFYGIEKLPVEQQPETAVYRSLEQITLKELMKSYGQLDAAEELLAEAEREQIYVLAVKGVNTKKHYPESDMRSMGDIDILYRDSQHAQVKAMMEKLGYEGFQEGRKHDHYYRKPYAGVELHRELVAAESDCSAYYSDIWNRVQLRKDCRYVHEMCLEDEYIFAIVHLAEHFKNGGVGIRFLMDIFIYDRLKGMDRDYVKQELTKLKLWKFYRNVSMLADRWFGEQGQQKAQGQLQEQGRMYLPEKASQEQNRNTPEQEQLLDELEAYIIANGTYGSQKHAAALSVEEAGRNRFLLRALFPNLKSMQTMFPWLKKYPVLLPAAWFWRGVRSLIFRRQNIRSQVEIYKNGDREHGRELRRFYEQCGL